MPLGPRKGLMVVRFLKNRFLLGVTDQQITVLSKEPVEESFEELLEEHEKKS